MELVEERQAATEDETSAEYQLLQRYWRDAERSFHRAVKLLESVRTQPAAAVRQAENATARAEARQNSRFRFVLDARKLEGSLLEREISLPDKEKAAPLGSLRQAVQKLVADRLAAPVNP